MGLEGSLMIEFVEEKKQIMSVESSLKSIEPIVKFIKKSTKVVHPSTFHDI